MNGVDVIYFEAARDLDELLNLAGQYLEQADRINAVMIYRVSCRGNSAA